MRVIAKSKGFYKGSRRRPGEVFEMSEDSFKKVDGKPVLPAWVAEAKDEAAARKQVADAKVASAKKERDAAVVSSGGAAAKAKADDVAEQLV
jgi:hypothetical protein